MHLNITPSNLYLDVKKDVAIFGGFRANSNFFQSPWSFPEQVASEASDVFSLGMCFLYYLQQILNVNFGFGGPKKVSLRRQLESLRSIVKGQSLLESLTTILCQMVGSQSEQRPLLAELARELEEHST